MNEKEYAINIKNELASATEDLKETKDFICCECSRSLENLTNHNINPDYLIEECKKINLTAVYANQSKDSFWHKEWEKQPCIVFAITDSPI